MAAESGILDDDPITVVMNADECYLPYVMVTVKSLFANSRRRRVDVRILHRDIPQEAQDWFVGLYAGRSDGHSVGFVSVADFCARMEVGSVSVRGAGSKAASLRLIAPLALPDVHRAIYLDADLIVLEDVADLWSVDLGDSVLAAAVDYGAQNNARVIDGFAEFAAFHGFDDWPHYINSGVMVMDFDRLRSDELIVQRAVTLSSWNKLYFADQDAINFTCQGRIRMLDPRWNVQVCSEDLVEIDISEAKIVHYAGPKPWQSSEVKLAKLWWSWFDKCLPNRLQSILPPPEPFTKPRHELERLEFKPEQRIFRILGMPLARIVTERFSRKLYVLGLRILLERVLASGADSKISVLGFEMRRESCSLVSFSNAKPAEIGINANPRSPRLIVSLTSRPKQIFTLHRVVESLLLQTVKPDEIVLWLAEEWFPDRERYLPSELLRLRRFGLTIRWCKSLWSYAKLIPTLKEHPEDIVVTCDDDVIYPAGWLGGLYRAYQADPAAIHCHQTCKIAVCGGMVLSYALWRHGKGEGEKGVRNLPLGAAGVLYPPHSLDREVLREDLFKRLAPKADDLWFWAMAVKAGSRIALIPEDVRIPYEVKFADQSSALWHENVVENDEQFAAILKHYPEIRARLFTPVSS